MSNDFTTALVFFSFTEEVAQCFQEQMRALVRSIPCKRLRVPLLFWTLSKQSGRNLILAKFFQGPRFWCDEGAQTSFLGAVAARVMEEKLLHEYGASVSHNTAARRRILLLLVQGSCNFLWWSHALLYIMTILPFTSVDSIQTNVLFDLFHIKSRYVIEEVEY